VFPIFGKWKVVYAMEMAFQTFCGLGGIAGTGAWESALMNTLSPGDKIIAPRFGQFGVLWINLMTRLHFNVDVIDSEWGEGVNLAILKRKLQADHGHKVKAVCVVHNETATGVTTNLTSIRQVLGTSSTLNWFTCFFPQL